ncbi:hypothetical protein F4804DRAFT_328360 [Jackrogersella minutella]|nr:hypothetical protein F4804DRAFT_328360 [Jackrogersella minutella]
MLFPENDAPLLRAWIIRRLANTSDADADVLADYVLALLRHDGNVESIRKIFEDEIPDFLRDDAAAFTDDVFRALQHRSYLPGAPPAPPSSRPTLPPHPTVPTNLPPLHQYGPKVPYSAPLAVPAGPTFPQGGSRKRLYNDQDDNDVDIILNGQGPYHGHQPNKQPRRGGNFSRRSYGSDYTQPGFPRPSIPNRLGQMPPPPAFPSSYRDPNEEMPQFDLNGFLGGMQGSPQFPWDLPKPVYSGTIPQPPRRKRCRDFDTRGYCSRGSNCKFEHAADPVMPPPAGASASDEYDPSNAIFSLPPMPNHNQSQSSQPSNLPSFPTAPHKNRREPHKPRRIKGRAPIAGGGPVHDKSKTAIVIQNIPLEHFTEEKVRDYFSQFGNIAEISMQVPNLAIVKFETWDAAHAAWNSPKVIFDNRFVKVYWHKDEAESGPVNGNVDGNVNGKARNGPKNGIANGNALAEESTPEELFDMEEFMRKQEEAQKAHEEKSKKREELKRQQEELEELQKKLRARQLEEKRKLQAKIADKGTKQTVSETGDGTNMSTSQTETLRAQLAALEEEANNLGIDPDTAQDEFSSWPRGRGRGSRVYRGRARFAPRVFRGGYGPQDRASIHAAYAVYSLDNRPKIIALSGVDFTNSEKDEVLRQYLFGIGEFKEIHTEPATTHITFKDRKTAEQFMFGVSANNTIPGLDDKIEIVWATSAPQSETKPTADSDTHMTSGIEDEQGARDKTSAGASSATAELEEGEVDNTSTHDQHDMDYESGQGWDMA